MLLEKSLHAQPLKSFAVTRKKGASDGSGTYQVILPDTMLNLKKGPDKKPLKELYEIDDQAPGFKSEDYRYIQEYLFKSFNIWKKDVTGIKYWLWDASYEELL